MKRATPPWRLSIGASVEEEEKTTFRVWAPKARQVSVRLLTSGTIREAPLDRDEQGYFVGAVEEAQAGDRYSYILDGALERPDPASRFQPEGVHGPSMVVDPASFVWTDRRFRGRDLSDYVIYELHVGAFTEAGAFDGTIAHLGYLKDLGVTAVELMPICQFPGMRNWGYDGVYPYAPQNSYGGPSGLKRFIDASHSKGLSVILDVVYNHLGPEGAYLNDFGPYFTDRYKTPWGSAVNFDGPHSDEVRRYFVSNACYWVSEFHADGLRLDAIHGIFDFSARHFLLELNEAVHTLAEQLGRRVYLIAESDLDDVRVINPASRGGHGIDAQWNDDFHHSLHTLLFGERTGYYEDFGKTEQMAKAIREGFVYTGQYSSYRKRRHGSSSRGRPARQFIHFSQNHDQVGNRPLGDRPSASGSIETLKLAAAVALLTPGIPLLFMGEEYGEIAPFPYFVDHTDPSLNEAVKRGRTDGFDLLGWSGDIPDPSMEATFLSSKIDLELRSRPGHKEVFAFYKEILRLRRVVAVLKKPTRKGLDVQILDQDSVITVTRQQKKEAWLIFFNFAPLESRALAFLTGTWNKVLDSSSAQWGGPGELAPLLIRGLQDEVALAGHSAVLYKSIVPDEMA
jgi:maltooligosyltrehalose trehalohydrolase